MPSSAIDAIGMSGLRLYLQANNLFTITGYNNIDPALPAINRNQSGVNTTDQTRNIDRGVTNSKPSTEDCRVVKHMMGETCIPRNPQRLITLRPDHLANSLALGIEPIASAFVEGFPFPKDIQGKVDKIESVGDISRPNLESILRLKPDLIISNSRLKGIYDQLSQIAHTVVLNIPFPPPSWKEQLTSLAQFLDKGDVSKKLIDDYQERIEQLKQALGSRRNQIEVSVANSSSEFGIWAYGEKHFVGEVLSDIG